MFHSRGGFTMNDGDYNTRRLMPFFINQKNSLCFTHNFSKTTQEDSHTIQPYD